MIYLKGQTTRMSEQEREDARRKVERQERNNLNGFIRIFPPPEEDESDY